MQTQLVRLACIRRAAWSCTAISGAEERILSMRYINPVLHARDCGATGKVRPHDAAQSAGCPSEMAGAFVPRFDHALAHAKDCSAYAATTRR